MRNCGGSRPRRCCASTATPPAPAPLRAPPNWRCRCWRRTARCSSPRLPGGEDPDTLVRRQGARRFAGGAGRRTAVGRRAVTTCCAKPWATQRRSSAPRFRTRLERPRAAHPAIGAATVTGEYRSALLDFAAPAPGQRPTAPIGRHGLRRSAASPRSAWLQHRGTDRARPHPHRDPAAPPMLLHDVEHAYAGARLPRRSATSARRALLELGGAAEVLDSQALIDPPHECLDCGGGRAGPGGGTRAACRPVRHRPQCRRRPRQGGGTFSGS